MDIFRKASMLTLATITALSVAGCKLSDLIDDDESGNITLLQGKALAGRPITSATIDIKDANGQEFRVVSDEQGTFSLVAEEMDHTPLAGPVVVRMTTATGDVMYSVLCNVVYGRMDTVNVHALTTFAMNKTSPLDDQATYNLWETTAKTLYCNASFADNFRDLAYTVGTDFNFFNTSFNADGTGFDAVLQDFDASLTVESAVEPFLIQNSLGSLVTYAGSEWLASGTVTAGSVSETLTDEPIGQQEITVEELRTLIEDLVEEVGGEPVQLVSVTVTLDGTGLGEEGTVAEMQMSGQVSLESASAIKRSFDIALTLERTTTP